MNDVEKLLTVQEVGAALGVGATRVRQLAAAGRLPCHRTGLGRLFAPAAVREFAATYHPRDAEGRAERLAEAVRSVGRPVGVA